MASRSLIGSYGDEIPLDDKRRPDDIELATRERNHIENRQCRDRLSGLDDQENKRLKKKYGNIIKERSEATALYNCHGLTFASRRTIIFGPETLKLILAEDNYDDVPKDKVMPGDVILYVSEKGDIEHSGIVVEPPTESCPLPLVVSKWGVGPEYVHRANQCEYDFTRLRYVRARAT